MAKIKKILLIITPTTEFQKKEEDLSQKNTEYIPQPLGLAYLGAVLQREGYEVEIFDPHIEIFDKVDDSIKISTLKSMISKKVNESDYDLLGISSVYIYTYRWAHYIAKVAKQKNKDMPVVIGGGYPSLLVEKVLEDLNIDYLVRGEGEVAFLQLLNYLKSEKQQGLEKLEGVMHRLNDKIIFRPRTSYIKNIDDIPFPAWQMVDVEKYMQFAGKRRLLLISSRGCPYSCTFCNSYENWGRGFRQRSAENILAEVDYLIKEFKVEDILFVDDNMTVDKQRFMKIAKGIKERNIAWQTVNISSFTTDEEMLIAMKESGCDYTAIAVESAVPETLKKMRKPVDLERTKELVKFCRKIGLQCSLFYISGLPYDTKEEMLQTFRYSEEVRGDWNQYAMLVPYPGTDIYRECEKKGYFIEPELDLSQLTIRNKGFIETENWDREWAYQMTYDYNIKTNFLKNYNLIEDDGDVNWAIENIGHVARFHPEHVIAVICLAYAYDKTGKTKMAQELLEKADNLWTRKKVQETYSRYLDWDDEKVIQFYKKRSQR